MSHQNETHPLINKKLYYFIDIYNNMWFFVFSFVCLVFSVTSVTIFVYSDTDYHKINKANVLQLFLIDITKNRYFYNKKP